MFRHLAVLSLSLCIALACSEPVAPPVEIAAPELTTATRLEAREGVWFQHKVFFISNAPPVTFTLENAPTGLTIDAAGFLTWTPTHDQAGEYTFTLVATDAQTPALSTSLALTIVVANSNRAPTTPVITTLATFPTMAGSASAFEANATDPDGDTLTWTWSVSDEAWELTPDGRLLAVTAAPTRGASAVITVTVSDGADSASATYDVTTIENTAPSVAIAAAPTKLLGKGTLALTAQGEDGDDDALTYTWTVEGAGWSVAGNGATATVTAPGVVDASGVVKVTVADGWGGSAEATHTLTAQGLAISASAEYLAGEVELTGPGGEVLTVVGKNAFTFDTAVFPTDAWAVTISGQPENQKCHFTTLASGTVGEQPIQVKLACAVALETSFSPTVAIDTTSTTYETIPTLDAIPLEIPKPSHALVTLSVPHALGDSTIGIHGKVWFAITVDGTVIAETMWENAHWGQGGPAGIVTTLPLVSGTHEVRGVWRVGDTGAKATIAEIGSVVLTATIIESLPHGLGAVGVDASFAGDEAPESYEPLDLDALAFPGEALALVSLQVPQLYSPGEARVKLQLGTDPVANGVVYHEGTRHGLSLTALRDVDASTELTAQWEGSAESAMGAGDVRLTATLFDENIVAETRSGTDDDFRTDTEFGLLGLTPIALTLEEPKTVLVLLQVPAAYCAGNGSQGEIAVRVGGETASLVRVQSQNGGVVSQVSTARLLKLPAGQHSISAEWRRFNGDGIGIRGGIRSLTAIVLD